MSSVSGHVFRYEGKRRPVWRAKYRLPDGRQVQKTIGPAEAGRRSAQPLPASSPFASIRSFGVRSRSAPSVIKSPRPR